MHVLPCGIINHLHDQHEVSLLFCKASYSVFWNLLLNRMPWQSYNTHDNSLRFSDKSGDWFITSLINWIGQTYSMTRNRTQHRHVAQLSQPLHTCLWDSYVFTQWNISETQNVLCALANMVIQTLNPGIVDDGARCSSCATRSFSCCKAPIEWKIICLVQSVLQDSQHVVSSDFWLGHKVVLLLCQEGTPGRSLE